MSSKKDYYEVLGEMLDNSIAADVGSECGQ